MRLICFLFIVLNTQLIIANDLVKDEINSILALSKIDLTQALDKTDSLLNLASQTKDSYLLVKANYTKAYLLDDVVGDFGKSILYYLEAIRYAEKSDYNGVTNDLISLNKNCGVIFRKFKAYELALQYYNRALEKAILLGNTEEELSLSYNISNVLIDQERVEEAIALLNKLILNVEKSSADYWKFSNRLGNAYYEAGMYQEAINTHLLSLNMNDLSDKNKGYTYHNLARNHFALGNHSTAEVFYHKAIDSKEKLSNKSYLFSSYKDLGELYLSTKDIPNALAYLNKAEELIELVSNEKYFDLYKLKADVLFESKQFIAAKKYEDLFSGSLENYILLQEEIQEADKKYNMDLITKRYFDELEKQERIASILFLSKMISGSLLGLLLIVIGYNRYEKLKLRRTIERELIALRIID